ncbi:MAG: hypothetical protein ACP5I4_06990 [Oceanipulchritudo sp.]
MECGTARIEITPPFPTALFGYPQVERIFEPHKDRMLDPLQARAVYLKAGKEAGVLLVSLDLCILMNPDARALREAIAREVGLPCGRILVACTHTHSAPLARFQPAASGNSPEGRFVSDPLKTSEKYGLWLIGRIRKIARLAVSRKSKVTLSYRETFTGLGYNRRCRTNKGILHCWNIQEFPNRIPQPADKVRHGVVRLDYTGKPGGVVLESAGIHPVVMGKHSNRASADWPGHARRHIEKRMRGYQAVFFEGAAAQVQPWISTQEDPKALRLVGEAIGGEAVMMALNAQPLDGNQQALSLKEATIPGTETKISILQLGPLLLLGLPFELSANWADRICGELGRPVFFICLCNGWDSYWMSPEEFAEGGYEAEVAQSRNINHIQSHALLETLKAEADF